MEKSNFTRIVTPDLKEFINRRKIDIKSEINCVSIGNIESFDPDSQTATIKIHFQRVIKEANPLGDSYSSDKVVDYPMLVNCPVVVLNGGGAYLSFPIAAGDTCIVLFCDRDIDGWFETGGAYAPNSERMHDLSDGIAIVGIRSKRNPIDYDGEKLKLFFGNGYLTIDASGNIQLNSPVNALMDGVGISAQATKVLDLFGNEDAIIRGTELTLGAPVSSVGTTPEYRRIWVVTAVNGNVITLEERRLGLSIPNSPETRQVTVR